MYWVWNLACFTKQHHEKELLLLLQAIWRFTMAIQKLVLTKICKFKTDLVSYALHFFCPLQTHKADLVFYPSCFVFLFSILPPALILNVKTKDFTPNYTKLTTTQQACFISQIVLYVSRWQVSPIRYEG